MIDTAEKRRSAAGFRRLPGVTPNASKDQEWRQQAARRYSGILADEAEVDVSGNYGWIEYTMISCRMDYTMPHGVLGYTLSSEE